MIEKALTILLWGFDRDPVWRAAANQIGRAEHVAVRFVGKFQQQISYGAVRLRKRELPITNGTGMVLRGHRDASTQPIGTLDQLD